MYRSLNKELESEDKHVAQTVHLLQFHDFLKEFSLKNAIYTVANVWNDADKSPFPRGWHRLCLRECLKNEPAHMKLEDFFFVTNEKMVIENFIDAENIYQPNGWIS